MSNVDQELLGKAEKTLTLVRMLAEHQLTRDPAAPKARATSPRVRVLLCTQESFNHLPGLVGRAEFLQWTGLSSDELTNSVRGKLIGCYKPAGKKALYFKHEIARLTGYKL